MRLWTAWVLGFAAALAALPASTQEGTAEPAAPKPEGEAAPAPETSPSLEAAPALMPEAPPETAAPAEPARPVSPPEPGWGEKTFGVPIHGFLSTRYRLHWTEAQSDQDLYETLSLDIADPERHRVTVHLLARAAGDLDGRRDRNGFYVFDSFADTRRGTVEARLYHAYADVHRLPSLETTRVGRQSIPETPEPAYFDGARVDTEEFGDLRFQAGAYGGVPVHLYESSPDGDRLLGSFAQAKPWRGGRLRADWMHVRDADFLGTDRNDLYGLGFWQNMGESVQIHALHTRLEEAPRDLLLRGTFQQPEWDFRLQGSIYSLLETQKDFAVEFDPFFSSLFEYQPFVQTRWAASQGIGQHVVVDAGVDVRRLKNERDEGPYNRDFERYFLSPATRDFPLPGMSVGLTGEVWDSPRRDVTTFGADLTQKCSDALRTSVGTFYALYKYDFYLDRERDDVRTYYLRANYRLTESVRAELRYEWEDGEPDEIQMLRGGVTWSF